MTGARAAGNEPDRTRDADGPDRQPRDRESLERALRVAEQRYRAFFDHGPDGVVILEPDTMRILEFNDRVCQQLGYTREEFARLRVPDIEAQETPKETAEHVERIRRDGYDSFVTKHRTKTGELLDVRVVTHVIETGTETLYHCVWRDITERERAAESLRQSEGRFRTLVESAPEAIVLLDGETGRFIDCNQKACRLFELPRDELLTRGPVELSPPVQPNGQPSSDLAGSLIRRAVEGETLRFEWTHRTAGGTDIPCEIHLTRLPSTDRVLVRGSMVDISDRKRAEREREQLQAQLAQSQRMESVGRLAGGVAHDFNNMLSVILGHTELATDHVDPASALHDDLVEIRRAAERSADLTRQLLTFARKQTVAPEVLDLNAKVESMLRLLGRIIGENIDLIWSPEPGLPPVRVDPTQMDQVLANLCVNARDAIEDVGRITIETATTTLAADHRLAIKGVEPGEYVRLSVSDDGTGMDEETRAHIFEPFFTTKGVGEGTGLGLATVYGAIKQSGGFIDVTSEPGEGSTFSVYLPSRGGGAGEARGAEAEATPGGRETILLVEDEVAILELTRRMLEGLGYTVLPAGSPERALRIAREHAGAIDLLMTDVIMPDMNGRDLADAIADARPDIACVFMSGYTADIIAQHGILDQAVDFIQKPFTRSMLAESVRRALEG